MKQTQAVFINFALLKMPFDYGNTFQENQQNLLDSEPNPLFRALIDPLSEAYDIIAYSTDLNQSHSYEAETWLVDHDFAIDEVRFSPDNSFSKHVDMVLELVDDNALMVFETRAKLIECLRDNGQEVFEYV